MDLLHLVDRLEELIAEAQKMPIGNRVIIDRRRLLDMIDQMRISVPQEVREARDLVSDRDRILRDAEEESRIIVGRAEENAASLVEANAITEAARERAQEIADEAETRLTQRVEQANDDIQIRIEESRDLARQQMEAADSYALELLQRLDRQLQAFVGSVQAGIQQVEPERELPPAPYPGEFDPGPPAPGNFRSDDALDSLPENERDTAELTLTRHELPDMDVPAVTLPDPELAPAPVVMTEPEVEELPPLAAEPPAQPAPVEEASPPTSRFGGSVWGRSQGGASTPTSEPEASAPEVAPADRSGFTSSVWSRPPVEEPPAPDPVEDSDIALDPIETLSEPDAAESLAQIATNLDSPADDEPAASEDDPQAGQGPFSSLFGRPAADPPPPPATTAQSAPTTGDPASLPGSNLPTDGGRLPGAGAVPPPTPSGSRFGLFGRRDQPAAELEVAETESPTGAGEANGDSLAESPAAEESSASAGFGTGLAAASRSNGEFEDLLAQARETADPVPAALPEDLAEPSTSDEPTVVIDDFDNPPLDDDPLHGDSSDASSDDRPRPPSVY